MKLPIVPKDFVDYAQRLRDQAVKLKAFARDMEVEGFDVLSVNNAKMAEHGMDDIDDFLGYAKRALREAQKEKEKLKAKTPVKGKSGDTPRHPGRKP